MTEPCDGLRLEEGGRQTQNSLYQWSQFNFKFLDENFVNYLLGHKQLSSDTNTEMQTLAFKNLSLEFVSLVYI